MDKRPIAIAGIVVAIIAAVIIGTFAISTAKPDAGQKAPVPDAENMTIEEAHADIEALVKNINVSTGNPSKGAVDFDDNMTLNLPDINSKYPLTIKGNGNINIEIFSSTEKAGSDMDGWLNRMAEQFNSEKNKTSDGKTMSVSVRKMPSGAAVDYMAANVYRPKAYTPSNTLFGDLVTARGCKLTIIDNNLIDNAAGIAISSSAESTVKEKYKTVDIKTVTQAAIDGEIEFGYVYPYTSATGLNYLVSALQSFDSKDMLSDTAVKQLQSLQSNIDFICYTTDQMTKAMQNGSLDAGVVEWQSFKNKATLQGYKFIPFGYEHNNPMYAVGNLSDNESETLRKFTEYCKSDAAQKEAVNCGFNTYDYTSDSPVITGDKIYTAQQIWKSEKNASASVAAVFVADCSGSMNENNAIGQLKDALTASSNNIAATNSIGLVSYSDNVKIELPIREFDLDQRAYFSGAVNNLSANGNTATYDAMIIALSMLHDYQIDHPDVKPMIFLLSDGQANIGTDFNRLAPTFKKLGVPCYTIGYNYDSDELKAVSQVNEAASINADGSDVAYELSMLFNAQM